MVRLFPPHLIKITILIDRSVRVAVEARHAIHGGTPRWHLHDRERRPSRCRWLWSRKRPKPVSTAVRSFATCRLAFLDTRQHDNRPAVPLRGYASSRWPRADLRVGPPNAGITRGTTHRGVHPTISNPGVDPASRDCTEHRLGIWWAVPYQGALVPRPEYARLACGSSVKHARQYHGRTHHLPGFFVHGSRLYRHRATQRASLASRMAPAVCS